jgi:ACS family hexuronate transporter-like MFS transporter
MPLNSPSPAIVPRRAWFIIVMVVLAAALNYFDRNIVAVLKPVLKAEFTLSDLHYSWLVTAFLAPYVVMYVLAGRLVDHLGSRITLAVFLAGWSLATGFTGLVGGLAGLLVCRFFLGVMEPGGFIACQRAIVAWFPPARRGLAMGIFSIGTQLGTVLAPPVLAALTGHLGWRWAFFVPGAIGVTLALVWWRLDRGAPDFGVSKTEPARAVPFKELLKCRALWGLLIARVIGDPVWIFYLFWVPGYFQEKLGLSLDAYGRIGWIPPAVGTLLGLALAFWCDRRIARGGTSLLVRRNALIAFTVLAPLGLLTPFLSSPWLVLITVTVVYSVAHMWNLFSSLMQTDLFPPGAVGTALGLIGACGSLCGLLFNMGVGWGMETIGYKPILIATGLLHPIAAVVVWRLVREPLRVSATESAN